LKSHKIMCLSNDDFLVYCLLQTAQQNLFVTTSSDKSILIIIINSKRILIKSIFSIN
jgi:hypothetical protein